MKVKFWGVRGSIACPGPKTVYYGGNTSCIELYFEKADRLIIIDAGSGIRPLGHDLKKRTLSKKGLKADIFLSHTHWDHIMGFPFFDPIYLPGTELNIYGPVTYEEETLEKIIGAQLSYRYFPVRHSELASTLRYHQLKECEIDLGDGIHLKTKFLNHTLQCLGYRFEYQGKSLCTAFDTEPFHNLFAMPANSPDYDPYAVAEGKKAADEENRRIVAFCLGADMLIHDAQYSEEEYETDKRGWGHSSFEHAIATGTFAKVKKLYLFHHDPARSDKDLATVEHKWRKKSPGDNRPDIYVAKEGATVEL
ncbi:MAG: MBL fold metallo-hydrolase [Desulfobacterales bacterium]|nr:MBL fold metallo-hydrolase [Desulfobacterales bacterium]